MDITQKTEQEELAFLQWKNYKLFCRNQDTFEFTIGKRLDRKSLYELISSNVISEKLPSDKMFQLVRLNNSWVPIDELIAPLIVRLNEKGYITSFCCSGHNTSAKGERYNFDYFYDLYDNNYYIEFAENQTKVDLETVFELLFFDIMGRELTDEEIEKSEWLNPSVETYLVLLVDESTNIFKGKIEQTKNLFHIKIPKNNEIPEQIKAIILCRRGNKFTFRAVVQRYYQVTYINQYLYKLLNL